MLPAGFTASQSWTWPGDLSKNGIVDIIDLNLVLIDWGKTGVQP